MKSSLQNLQSQFWLENNKKSFEFQLVSLSNPENWQRENEGGSAWPAALSSVFDIAFLKRLPIRSGDIIKPFFKHYL
jgi:hypothetical protein